MTKMTFHYVFALNSVSKIFFYKFLLSAHSSYSDLAHLHLAINFGPALGKFELCTFCRAPNFSEIHPWS
jgi:hypothetical protein